VGDIAVHDMAAGFDDFEPVEVLDGLRSPRNRVADGGVGAVGRGANQFDDLVGVVGHHQTFLVLGRRGETGNAGGRSLQH
jgi:hypothetical protein